MLGDARGDRAGPARRSVISSPTLIGQRRRRPFFDRHLGLAAGVPASHQLPAITFSFASSFGAVGDGELARQAAAPAHLLVALERRRRALRRRRRARAAPGSASAPAPSPFCAVDARPLTPSRWSGWMSIRNMSGASSPTCTAKSRSRLACSARTPRMKKVPRPTASRMTRVWLPGRTTCSTACRSANERA